MTSTATRRIHIRKTNAKNMMEMDARGSGMDYTSLTARRETCFNQNLLQSSCCNNPPIPVRRRTSNDDYRNFTFTILKKNLHPRCATSSYSLTEDILVNCLPLS